MTDLDLIPLSDLIDAIDRRTLSYAIVVRHVDSETKGLITTFWNNDLNEYHLLGMCEALKQDIIEDYRK